MDMFYNNVVPVHMSQHYLVRNLSERMWSWTLVRVLPLLLTLFGITH